MLTKEDIDVLIGILNDKIVSLKERNGTEYRQSKIQALIKKLQSLTPVLE